MDNQQETKFAWLAGIMDGEGYVAVAMNQHKTTRSKGKKAQYIPRLTIGSTSSEIIEKCVEVINLAGTGCLVQDRRVLPSGKTFKTVWVVGAKRNIVLLPKILPYLTLKRKNVELVLEFIESRLSKVRNVPYTERELEIVSLCKQGSSETTREAPAFAG